MLHWVTCTPRILALKQHLSSSAFLLFLQTGSLVKALPTGSNWGLVCHHCHKPHVGLEHLVSERVVVKPFSDDICYNNKKTWKASGCIVRISSALSQSTLARLTWVQDKWSTKGFSSFYLLQFCKLLLGERLFTRVLVPKPALKSKFESDVTWITGRQFWAFGTGHQPSRGKWAQGFPEYSLSFGLIERNMDWTSSAVSSRPPTKRSTSSTLS